MIKLHNLTPSVYYKQSRDFQFVGRLYDIVLNYVLTNAEAINNLTISDNTDNKFVNLIASTLGFYSKHNYNVPQLIALSSAFSKIIHNKGNLTSINIAINTLLTAEGIDKEAYIDFDSTSYNMELFIPQELTDLNLIYDLLDYTLPAGITCTVYRGAGTEYGASTNLRTTVNKVTYAKDGDKDPYNSKATISSLTKTSIIPQIYSEEYTTNESLKLDSRNSRETLTTINMLGYMPNVIVPKIENITNTATANTDAKENDTDE